MPEESRIEKKIDEILNRQIDLMQEMHKVSERLAVQETLVKERTDDNKEVHDRLKDLEERMGAVEKHKTQVISFKEIALGAVGLIGTVAVIWGVLK